MNLPPRGGPPVRVPTLTEVIELPGSPGRAVEPPAVVEVPEPATEPAAEPVSYAGPDRRASAAYGGPERRASIDEWQVTERVLTELQRQVELMLDYRLREALAPALARAADALVRDARGELASTLREMVSRAVSQELSRHRQR